MSKTGRGYDDSVKVLQLLCCKVLTGRQKRIVLENGIRSLINATVDTTLYDSHYVNNENQEYVIPVTILHIQVS